MSRSSAFRSFAILLFVLAAFPSNASAWGADGHRIVCRIAYQLLDGPQQAEIRRLTSAFRRPDGGRIQYFTDGCVFPDEARANAVKQIPKWEAYAPFGDWHFLNLPRTARQVDEAACGGDCVLTGLARHAQLLRTETTDQARATALFFLGHWSGDVHQPLHVSYADDRGGNLITPINGSFYTSRQYPSTVMHAVWDSGIIRKAVGTIGWRIYADRLASRITSAQKASWAGGTPVSWAQESYDVATASGTQYCEWKTVAGASSCVQIAGGRTFAKPYQTQFQDDVELRLQQAGARLAEMLRASLGGAQ